MNTYVDIADAVVAALDGATLSTALDAQRAYVVHRDVSRLDGLRAYVMPAVYVGTAADLGRRIAHQWTVAVWVQEKVGSPDPSEVDPLLQVVEEVVRLFLARPLAGTDAHCIGVELEPPFDREKLETLMVFSSVVLLTFRLRA